MMTYRVARTEESAEALLAGGDAAWATAGACDLDQVRPEGSDHRPRVTASLLHGGGHLFGRFQVGDRFVRCARHGLGVEVWKDSCVECFVQPAGGAGYINFEFSANGSRLASHIRDARRGPGGFADSTPLTPRELAAIRVGHSLRGTIDPELPGPVDWWLTFAIPFDLLTERTGARPPAAGARWRGNFYKCGDETSHPHWISWSPVDELNFHLPRCFGEFAFA